MEKYGRVGQATADNIIRSTRFGCWINKATDTHSLYVIINALPSQNGYANAHKCYVYTYTACLFCINWSVIAYKQGSEGHFYRMALATFVINVENRT